MARQAIGADVALDDLVRTHTRTDPETVYSRPVAAPWRDHDDAELRLRRFLQRYEV